MIEWWRRYRQVMVGALTGGLFVGLIVTLYLDLMAPQRALAEARAQWEANNIRHYRIEARRLGWGGCRNNAEFFHDRIITVAENSCRYASPLSVRALFQEVERVVGMPEIGTRCRRGLNGRDCACYAPFQVAVSYHPELGYPQEVVARLNGYAPNRLHIDYWRYLFANRREPICGGPLEPADRHIVIQEFEEIR